MKSGGVRVSWSHFPPFLFLFCKIINNHLQGCSIHFLQILALRAHSQVDQTMCVCVGCEFIFMCYHALCIAQYVCNVFLRHENYLLHTPTINWYFWIDTQLHCLDLLFCCAMSHSMDRLFDDLPSCDLFVKMCTSIHRNSTSHPSSSKSHKWFKVNSDLYFLSNVQGNTHLL